MDPTPAQLLREFHIARTAARYDEALGTIERLEKLAPRDARALLEKADLLRHLGRVEEARRAAHRATVLAPTEPLAFARLGLAFTELRKFNEAERAFERALRFDRRHADALAGYARLRLRQKRLAEAEELAANAVRARPADARLYVLLGDIFAARANRAGMVEAYRRARDLDPLDAEALEKYVDAKEGAGGLDAARAALEDAVARMPDSPLVHQLLGKFLSDHGLLDEAVASLRRALALDPAFQPAVTLLATSKTFRTVDDPDLDAIRSAYRQSEPKTPTRGAFAFALAKALDDAKDYGPAFDAYLEGNAIRRQSAPFSIDDEARTFADIAATFSAERIAALRGHGEAGRTPIFILGMPRSGTTLTETILSRHPDVHAAGELEFMKVSAARVVGAVPVEEARRFGERLRPDHLAAIGAGYLGMLDARARAAPRFTDKMPHNFRLLGLIRLVFPHARIVHIRRDPVDNCLSMFKANFKAEALGFSFDLTDLGRYYNLYRGLMRHWRAVLPGEFFEIDYESLVSDPESATRALFAYCGLGWSPEVLHVEESRREVKTASFAQVRRPIHRGSVSAADRYGDRLDPLRAALAEWRDQ